MRKSGLVKSWKSPLRMSDGSIKPYEVRELIIAGAELGADKYKRVYRLAEKVLSSANS